MELCCMNIEYLLNIRAVVTALHWLTDWLGEYTVQCIEKLAKFSRYAREALSHP